MPNLHEQPLGVFHHSTLKWVLESIHKHLVEDVNVAYIRCAHVQDFIRGQEDRGDVQCCFIKHHIRKNAEEMVEMSHPLVAGTIVNLGQKIGTQGIIYHSSFYTLNKN